MIRDFLQQATRDAVTQAMADGALPQGDMPEFSVERPRQADHGDYSTNVAMLLAKLAKKPPLAIAQELAGRVSGPALASVEPAPPGFINFRLDSAWVGQLVAQILEADERFGETESGKGKRVLVEHVSANPNGPITLGHGRNGVLGDVLARCFRKAGWQAETEFYLNDSSFSLQMRLFAESVKALYLQSLGVDAPFPEDGYKGEYIAEIAADLRKKHGDNLAEGDPAEVRERFQRLSEEELRAEQERDLADYRLHFDRYFREQTLHDNGLVQAAIAQLRENGHTYEADGAFWLRSTTFGDDKDRPIIRSNGTSTYIASDAAYHKDKYDRGYDLMIDVLGADHHGYIGRMKAVMAALGYDPDKLVIFIYQLVRLWRGKEQVRMSTRAGDIITLREVLDEVGTDMARFFFLMRSHDTTLDFDLELAKKKSDENPVYYVQYAHARICSILRKADEDGFKPTAPNFSLLTLPAETALILRLLELPDEVERVVTELAPHRLTGCAVELARLYHQFYDNCRVLDPAVPALSSARLALCHATRITLRNTFELIGISSPERM